MRLRFGGLVAIMSLWAWTSDGRGGYCSLVGIGWNAWGRRRRVSGVEVARRRRRRRGQRDVVSIGMVDTCFDDGGPCTGLLWRTRLVLSIFVLY